jgi:hypothetical protein
MWEAAFFMRYSYWRRSRYFFSNRNETAPA